MGVSNAIAKKILDELGSRAKAGDGLAMDYASRMKRAKEGGFDTGQVYYHGTDAGDISAFKNIENRAGEGKPIYMAPSPALANRFSDAGEIGGGEVVYPLMAKVKNTFDFRNEDHLNSIKHFVSAGDMKRIRNGEWRQIEEPETMEAIKSLGYDSFNVMEGNVSKAYAEADRAKSRIFPNTAKGKKEGRDFYQGKVREWNDKSGKNTLKPEINTTDDGFTIDYQGGEYKTAGERAEGSAGVNLGVFDTSDIRSVNAAFDPAKRTSSNLLASALPAAAGLGALYTPEQAMASPTISDYLQYGREDTITPVEYPMLDTAADYLDKYTQTPIGPALEGMSGYLRDFGRERSAWERYKSAAGAALDFM